MSDRDSKPIDVMEFLKMLTEDAQVPENFRIEAARLVADPTANPFAPPIRLTIENDKVVGRANFGPTFEGYPGTVHGGFVAAAFDQVLYRAQSLTGIPAMTATLTISYSKPTPLRTDLVFEGVVDRIEGRKILTRGRVSANGVVTAEAEGLFIAVGNG